MQQLALAFPRPPATITALMKVVEAVLVRISTNGSTMPNNPMLGQRCGGRGRSSMDRALRRLASIGHIQIEYRHGLRRVFVVQCGRWTDWGEARKGHAPFSTTPRPPKGWKPPQPVAIEQPRAFVRAVVFFQPEPEPRYAGPRTCQWPMWSDQGKSTGVYCDAPVNGKGSYCAAHQAMASG